MQKRRKPEPIQLNPIPDGNAVNGTGATEWVGFYGVISWRIRSL